LIPYTTLFRSLVQQDAAVERADDHILPRGDGGGIHLADDDGPRGGGQVRGIQAVFLARGAAAKHDGDVVRRVRRRQRQPDAVLVHADDVVGGPFAQAAHAHRQAAAVVVNDRIAAQKAVLVADV